MQRRLEIPIGTRFGKLMVVENAGGPLWKCMCDCGNVVIVSGAKLNSGNNRSCGCQLKETLTNRNKMTAKHNGRAGGKKERLYSIWEAMRKRCRNVSHKHYADYGGRGITVCQEWEHDYAAFRTWALDNGYSDGLTIDRIETDGDYTPTNCRWATPKQQANNRRNNLELIECFGKRQSLMEWASETGFSYSMLHTRLFRRNWSPEKALTTPSNRAK